MDLRNLSEEQNRELPLGEERGNVFGSSSRRCRWASSPTSDSTKQTSVTALVSTFTSTNSQQSILLNSIRQPAPQNSTSSPALTFQNSVINLVDLSNQNQANSSDDDDDGGDDQDEESDTAECSSSDNEDSTSSSSPPELHAPAGKSGTSSDGAGTGARVEDEIEAIAGAYALLHTTGSWRDEPFNSVNSKYILPSFGNCKEGSCDLRQATWPLDRPIPFPTWDNREPQVVTFNDILEYEEFAGCIELVSQQTVASHKYNTVGNYIRFYQEFKNSGEQSLEKFFRQYDPPITPDHYTCVGLAMELITRINNFLTSAHKAHSKFYLVSAEESIESVEAYIRNVPPDVNVVEKEHQTVCLKIKIGSGMEKRMGYLILDPGYHVSRVVTIMEDKLYPHTGWFVQEDTGKKKKEYEYVVASEDYVAWNVTETKSDYQSGWTNLIFVGRPFLSGVDFAERRNLLYDFKSMLQRDSKGRLQAGMYFATNPKKAKKVTLFYMENNNPIHKSLNMAKEFSDNADIRVCEEQMFMRRGELLQLLNQVGTIIHDEDFVKQSSSINNEIWNISRDN